MVVWVACYPFGYFVPLDVDVAFAPHKNGMDVFFLE